YATGGAADFSRARLAQVLDAAAALAVAAIIFPFPFARAVLPVPAFVATIFLTVGLVHVLYLVAALLAWGRTPAMFLLDLGVSPHPVDWARALRWSAGSALGLLPGLVSRAPLDPERGMPARFAGLTTCSTGGNLRPDPDHRKPATPAEEIE
ncbi:MAG: hypothetical protein Q8M66_03530, partial [Actinomycetota bacterium]|nr:hypothetical protein [Actinomycetota bacterium]